jgi:class 3 adenylate cyclase/alpha-beta hydrolase superfamily lysophospholipase
MPTVAPETRYARSGSLNVAYQVVGDGPCDLVVVPGWVSHVEFGWELPPLARFLERLASFARLIVFDKRGTGLSDRVADADLPGLDERMDDLRAVMDATDTKSAALFGFSEGGNLAMTFAAAHPARVTALVTFGVFAKRIWSPDYPWAPTPEARAKEYESVEREWGRMMDLSRIMPSMVNDREFSRRVATYLRRSASPGAAVSLLRMNTQIDVRHLLPIIKAPTLVMHRIGDLDANIEEGRYIAARIPGARFVELPGEDHLPWIGDSDAVVDEIAEFVTGARLPRDVDRVLATVLFTDIVGSTQHAARLGDRAWRERLAEHHAMARREIARWRGREVNTAGDGFFAVFDGPARAIRCALALHERLSRLDIAIRAGLHAGEVTVSDDDVSGLAVHIGARVAQTATAGETLVSSTVKDLVVGADLAFADRGVTMLKGVPGEWRLYAVGGHAADAGKPDN